MKNMALEEFLRLLATASGDECLELVSRFQSGSITVEGIAVEELD